MSASKFDRLERRAGESGRRRARAEAASRFIAMAAIGCPELSAKAFETHYAEALEALLLGDADERPDATTPPAYAARDYSGQYTARYDHVPSGISVQIPRSRSLSAKRKETRKG